MPLKAVPAVTAGSAPPGILRKIPWQGLQKEKIVIFAG